MIRTNPTSKKLQSRFSFTYFGKRIASTEPLLRSRFVPCVEANQLDDLVQEARLYLWQAYLDEPEMMDRANDDYWVHLALRGVLRLNETQSLFERQFAFIERRLHHWARQRFDAEIVEDVVQSAYINLWEDYQRHQQEWDSKDRSFWVACGKLSMRAANRALKSQTHRRKGSWRKREHETWVKHIITECEFPSSDDDGSEDEQNDLLDQLSQLDDDDIHGHEVKLANLRIDLERLMNTSRQHYRPQVFARCQMLLQRLVEGYTRSEIRLELGWSESTFDGTMTLIRSMARFAEGYERAPGRSAKLSSAETKRITQMRRDGCSYPEIARRIGRDPKTVWRAMRSL